MALSALLPFYKDFVTSRGLKYHYYFSAPVGGKPTLLFNHGFPSLSIDWHHQITYFKAKGYGLIIPDQLGYGGTDKPEDHMQYLHSLLARDLVDIVEHEKVANVFAVGHDWGSKTTSYLANLFSDRFLGFGFVALGYLPPNTTVTYEQAGEMLKKLLGYENFGYWSFFSAPDANEVIQKHSDAFWNIVHARDHRLAKYTVCPTGALRVFVESDIQVPRAPHDTEELRLAREEPFRKHGYQGALNFYKVAMGPDLDDAKAIPLEKYAIQKPVFFAGATQDLVCPPALAMPALTELCPNHTSVVFQSGHWLPLEKPEELNIALDEWISGVISK